MEKFDFDAWPTDDSIKIKLGAGQYKVAVFVDPNCPWCKRFFEEDIDKLTDIDFYVFLTSVLGEESEELSAAIYASKNPHEAWKNWIMNEEKPKAAAGEALREIVDRNTKLFDELKNETVPAVYLGNGDGPFGFMTALELVSKIEHLCKNSNLVSHL